MQKINGHEFGINLGYGFGDNSRATENAVFYDGIMHKLCNITVDFAKTGKQEDYNLAMKVKSDDRRLDATFLPIIDRHAKTDLVFIGSNQHQVFGVLSGKAKLDSGEVIDFNEIFGFIEKVTNKW